MAVDAAALTRRTPTALAIPKGVSMWLPLLGTLTVTAVTTSLIALAITLIVVIPWFLADRTVRAHMTAHAERLERRRIRRRRRARLDRAGVPAADLYELVAIVDDVTRADPLAAARLDLENLLDTYAGLAIAHHHCAEQLNRIDRESLVRRLAALDASRRSTRRELIERRLAARQETETRAAVLADRLAEIVELVRLYGDLASAPDVHQLLDAEILDRRLAQIEAADALDNEMLS
jgi:hypothetical protein